MGGGPDEKAGNHRDWRVAEQYVQYSRHAVYHLTAYKECVVPSSHRRIPGCCGHCRFFMLCLPSCTCPPLPLEKVPFFTCLSPQAELGALLISIISCIFLGVINQILLFNSLLNKRSTSGGQGLLGMSSFSFYLHPHHQQGTWHADQCFVA